jgi:hypothetical protein
VPVTARINNAPEPTQTSNASSKSPTGLPGSDFQKPTSSPSSNTSRGSDGVQATIQASASVGASVGHN